MTTGSAILEEQVTTLKHTLKTWENAFQAANGRKPGREDIKNDAAIADKYREYNEMRRPTSLASKRDKDPVRTPRKQDRPHSDALRARPINIVDGTPRRAEKKTASLEIVQEDEVEPTPAAIKCALGPTPQKDGQVLGIFDLPLSATPSRGSIGIPSISQASATSATPSKRAMAPPVSASKLSATPQSSGKRRFLDAFSRTPLKRKREEDELGAPSTAKRQFATPAFLRRSASLAMISEETEPKGSLPFLRRGLSKARSFSSLIQNLRSIEETRMDDEWDIMNEIEAEERGDMAPLNKKAEILVEDSQVGEGKEMPLGPDRAVSDDDEFDEGDASATNATGGKVWKKKGLKRQTKRTNMKPVLHRPKKAAELEREDEEDEADVVEEETQHAEAGQGPGDGYVDTAGDAEAGEKRKQTKGKEKQGSRKDLYGDNDSENPRKKVAATAHANFRALKIKNKNSKANGRGRFGKGRR
ncbi:DNA replication and checkpoint protein [Teratosphaeria destructans]|uniref:DNA replication regulator SLD2 n=1 Tax=Teratosphaeria destructans TaxID=418781 RepID=A0A9W7T246_9PEZI|nr:DNA replication and checkpoint protein [Teratosphaeria destructans]